MELLKNVFNPIRVLFTLGKKLKDLLFFFSLTMSQNVSALVVRYVRDCQH